MGYCTSGTYEKKRLMDYADGTYYHVKLAAFAVCRCQKTNVINSLAQNCVLNNKPYLKSI